MGVGDPKVGVPKMARPDFPNNEFRFFPTTVPLVWGGGGSGEGPTPIWFLIVVKMPCRPPPFPQTPFSDSVVRAGKY